MEKYMRRCLHLSAIHLRKKPKSASSQQWLKRHVSDPFVHRAQMMNYRARSAFKLIEIDDIYQILRLGGVVVDCGAAPGSWTQVAVDRVNSLPTDSSKPQGTVIAVDLLHFQPIEGALTLCQSDFTKLQTQDQIHKLLKGRAVDVVLSDMAPNASGIASMDHENIGKLFKDALQFSTKTLKENGHFLGKLWEGYLTKDLRKEMSDIFRIVKVVKPDASRGESAEIFLLGKGFKRNSFKRPCDVR